MRVLIIGGNASGACCGARLRRLDEKCEIVIFEKGDFISFASCGLPYFIGGEIRNEENLSVQTPHTFKSRFNIEVRVNSEVVGIDKAFKEITVRKENGALYKEKYDKLVIATGVSSRIPEIDGIDSEGVFTLRTIPDTIRINSYIKEKAPKKALIIGGGYIGIEMAENLTKRGISVTVAERGEHIIPSIDYDMSREVCRYLTQKGVAVSENSEITKIVKHADELSVIINGNTKRFDMIILSAGVKAESDLAKQCDLQLGIGDSILVDEHLETSEKDIYSAGDVIQVANLVSNSPSMIPLAGPASKQGRIVADSICGIDTAYKGTLGTSVLKIFDMTVAQTGLSEEKIKTLGYDYDKTYTYSPSHATYYPNAKMMSIKTMWDKKTLKILGCEIVGFDGVDKRIDVMATVISLGGKILDLKDLELCYAPPYSSAKDPINMVGFVADNVISGRLKQFFWHDVDSLPRDGSINLLDVRSEYEFSSGAIDGFINIPLDSIRAGLHRLDKKKPVYVHCHSGHRSYIACSILVGNGFDCYNLAGGYRFYELNASKKQHK